MFSTSRIDLSKTRVLCVNSLSQVIKLLTKGNRARTMESTSANQTSSRSHALLEVIVRQQNRIRNTLEEVQAGKLYMIDLAGSERASNTQVRVPILSLLVFFAVASLSHVMSCHVSESW